MKKIILILILLLSPFFVGLCSSQTMCDVTYENRGTICYETSSCRTANVGACSATSSSSNEAPACGNATCEVCNVHNYCSPSELCGLFTNSVGGCNNTPKYCSTSPVYQKVDAFLGGFDGGVSEFGHFSTIGLDNKTYRCRTWYKNASGKLYFMITKTSYTSINPQTTSSCLDDETFTALMNTNCSLGTAWAKPTGDIVNYRTGEKSNDGTGSAPEITPTTEVVGPTGKPLTEPTGIDNNKDGFDDVTGQVIPPSSGGIGDSDGDGTGEVEIKDPSPSEIPAVPSGGEYDTEIQSPEQKPLSGLFNVLDSSPFISVLQGTRIQLSGSQCHLTTGDTVYGRYISLDFCDSRIINILDYLGIIIVGIAAIIAILLIFV